MDKKFNNLLGGCIQKCCLSPWRKERKISLYSHHLQCVEELNRMAHYSDIIEKLSLSPENIVKTTDSHSMARGYSSED